MKSTSGLRPWAVRARMRSAAKMKLPLRIATAAKSLGMAAAISCASVSSRDSIASDVKSGSRRAASSIGLGKADFDFGGVGRRTFKLRAEGFALVGGQSLVV